MSQSPNSSHSTRPSWVRKHLAACPSRSLHTEGPDDYLAWHGWADDMMMTHRQERCPGCRLYVVWMPLALASGQKDEPNGGD